MADVTDNNQEKIFPDTLSNDTATINSLLEIINRQNKEIEQLRAGQNFSIKDDISSIKQMLLSIIGKLDKFIQVFAKFIDNKIKKE